MKTRPRLRLYAHFNEKNCNYFLGIISNVVSKITLNSCRFAGIVRLGSRVHFTLIFLRIPEKKWQFIQTHLPIVLMPVALINTGMNHVAHSES